MAKYDRDILVPYLNNLYALHLAKMRTSGKLRDIEIAENSIWEEYRADGPEKPEIVRNGWTTMSKVAVILLFIISLCAFITALAFWYEPQYYYYFDMELNVTGLLISLSLGILSLIGGILVIKFERDKNSKINMKNYREWEQKRKEFSDRFEIIKKNMGDTLSNLDNDKAFYKSQESQIDRLIDQSYAANVIPRQYRNVYAVYYLTEYFSSSSADDLDMVLQTFVLEQIKERLDRIIAQQEEIILNQQIAMADRIASNRSQEQFKREMTAKVDRLNASGEERNRYLAMIDSDVRATFWMATASYLKR